MTDTPDISDAALLAHAEALERNVKYGWPDNIDTEAEEQAAAQADYETRIRATLVQPAKELDK